MSVFRYPLASGCVALVIGILLYQLFQISLLVIFGVLLLAFIFWLLTTSVLTNKHFLIYCLFFFQFIGLGYVSAALTHPYNQEDFYLKFYLPNSSQHLIFTLTERLKPNDSQERFFANLDAIDNKKTNGKIQISINKDSVNNLELGTTYLVNAKLKPIAVARNPGQFDYNQYLKNKGIYLQTEAIHSKIQAVNRMTLPLIFYADQLRNTIKFNLQKSDINPESLSVLMALILGQQQDIPKEINQDYQYAGAVHILSVSGLHTGFIVLFLELLFQLLPNNKTTRLIRWIGILIGLWSFAFIAGLAAPIVRAATMFTLLSTARFLGRNISSLYCLFLSLFLLLLLFPDFLTDIGFQLSYLALAFIIWLQPLLQKLIPPSRLPKSIQNSITVSIAAQIGTLPLTLYYFHQFPGLFLITNLIIIPLTAIIMGFGLITIIGGAVSTIPTFLYWPTEKGILLMNLIIKKIASWKGFLFQEIPWSNTLLVITYIFLIICCWQLEKPKIYKRYLAFGFLLFIQGSWMFEQYSQNSISTLIIPHLYKESILISHQAKTIKTYHFDSINKDAKAKSERIIKNYKSQFYGQIEEDEILFNAFKFQNKSIIRISKEVRTEFLQTCDVLWLSKNPPIHLERIISVCKPKVLIADGSNYKNQIRQWEQTCRKMKIPFHNTYEKGAFYINESF